MADTVLIVDDDEAVLTMLYKVIRSNGIEADTVASGEEALERTAQRTYDLILLDVNLMGMDGFQVVQTLRQRGVRTPIIIVSGRKEDYDTLYGLDIGADDYVTKPFTQLELFARVNSHLRRYSKYLTAVSGEEQEKSHVYTIGGLELNEETVEVTVDGEAVKLTPMEFKIVQLLIKNPGRVFSADEIYERIWNEKAVNTDTIMVHVRNIREKIEIDPRNPKYLKVVWGVGYKIDKQ